MLELEQRLRTHRFIISEQSRPILHQLREVLTSISEESPCIKGLGIMGSRVKGYDKSSSDLDIVLYVKDSRRPYPSLEYCRELTKKRLKESCNVNAHIEAVVDIKESHLTKLIDLFCNDYKVKRRLSLFNIKPVSKSLLGDEHISDYIFDLMSPFFLTMGDVASARKFILEKFSKSFWGNQYLAILMDTMFNFERYRGPVERGRLGVTYEGPIPITISEAKRFFLSS